MEKKRKGRGRSADRSKDRHKPRKHLAIDPKVHRAMQIIADQNNRPLVWEIEGILIEVAKKAGLWPPPEEDDEA